MDNSEILQTILAKLDGLEKGQQVLNTKVNTLQNDTSIIKEDSKITRSGVNTLLDWAEKVQVQVSIPLYQKEK